MGSSVRGTQMYRSQHKEILKQVQSISDSLDPEKLARDASEVSERVSKLLGVLSVHLAMEDRSLYPLLLDHQDTNVRKMARKFLDEMGSIKTVVDAYGNKWAATSAIQRNAREFVEETKAVLKALARRVEAEDSQLYPAADRAL